MRSVLDGTSLWFVSVKFYGPESSGKQTLTLSVIAEAQKPSKTCAFIDAEHGA